MELKDVYEKRYNELLSPIAKRLELKLKDDIKAFDRVDSVRVRAKGLNSFINKANKTEDNSLKYTDPLNQIQDQVGARIIVFYLDDVKRVEEEILKYYRSIEKKTLVPESDSAFGYFGLHLMLTLPEDVILDQDVGKDYPPFFELQIKTLYQHAWSEANHDLGYKPDADLSTDNRRMIAFTAAQSWGADQMFQELKNATQSG